MTVQEIRERMQIGHIYKITHDFIMCGKKFPPKLIGIFHGVECSIRMADSGMFSDDIVSVTVLVWLGIRSGLNVIPLPINEGELMPTSGATLTCTSITEINEVSREDLLLSINEFITPEFVRLYLGA